MRTQSAAAWIAAFFLAACLFSGTVALRLLLLFGGAALCAWVAYRDRSIRVLPAIWLPFALWAGWAALSLTWSIDAERSLKELRNETAYAALALVVCHVAAQGPNARTIFVAVLAAGSVVASAISLYFYAAAPEQYPGGAHGGAGNHSAVLLTLLPGALLVAWHAMETRRARWIPAVLGALALLYAASAYATLNRTVWIGFGVEIVLVVALIARARRAGSRGTGGTRLLLAALACAVLAASVAWTIHSQREARGGALPLAEDPRILMWREVSERIEARPLQGYGFGRGLLRQELTRDTGDNLAWHAHNLFLDTLVQTGTVGLVLLLVLLGATLRQAWTMTKRADPLAIACGAALAAIVAGMLVRNMTDMLWVRHTALLYWGCVGALLAWGGRGGRAPA